MAITKTSALTLVSSGDRSANGFTHDNDQILLWGNATYNVSVTGSTMNLLLGNIGGASVDWQPFFVGYLNSNPLYTLSPQQSSWLTAHGITTAEYPNVLAADPLAVPGAVLDPTRFIPASGTHRSARLRQARLRGRRTRSQLLEGEAGAGREGNGRASLSPLAPGVRVAQGWMAMGSSKPTCWRRSSGE